MKTRYSLYVVLCLALILGFCSPGNNETKEIESADTTSEAAETTITHVGGCVLAAPAVEPPEDLYRDSDIIPTDEFKPFTKKLVVYGITLIGRNDISDDFMRKVAKTITEMFTQKKPVESEFQQEVLRNLYRYRTVIPLFKGEDHEFSPSDAEAWALTASQNSICDIIMEGVPGQVNEVVEHILHFVSDVGLHYTFPDEWGLSKSSDIYYAMQEAIDKGHYNIEQYNEDIEEEEQTRVLIQEYAYWVIFTAWNLYEPYGPQAEWTGIKNPDDLREKLPLSYDVFIQTIPRVMTPPSRTTLDEFMN